MDLRQPLVSEKVEDVGYRKLVAMDDVGTVAHAVGLMQSEKVGCLVVLGSGGELRGIFTERDLLLRVLGRDLSFDSPITEVMTPDPATAGVGESIHAVLSRMHAGGYRHLPVIGEAGAPVGTLSIKRAVHFLSDHLPAAVYNLPPDPENFPDRPEGG